MIVRISNFKFPFRPEPSGRRQISNFFERKRAENRRKFFGFSVVELLLYMGLLSIFLTILTQLFIASLQVQLASESISSVEQDGRYILSRFQYDILRSGDVQSPSGFGQEGTSLTLLVEGNPVVYSLSGSELMLDAGGSAEKISGANVLVSDLKFTKYGNNPGKPTVSLSFIVTSKVKQAKGVDSKMFQATFGLR
ncbi:MAG: hypothetical protein HYV40_02710 [Candidatus Levybacteria bacterium]|nr:hypothetical protein [Candidatus Levybacteria bacterium]